MAERSNRMEVRNPVLALPATAGLQTLPREAREALRAVLNEIADDAAERAQTCWKRHKAPMAAYWKAVSVYARHTARAIGHVKPAAKPPATDTLPLLAAE